MTYVLEISRQKFSSESEECRYKSEEGHNADGTGPECTGDCTSLEGGERLLKDYGTHRVEGTDAGIAIWDVYGDDPAAWAADYLSKHHPEITTASAGMTETFDARWREHVPDHATLTGEITDPHNPNVYTVTTVRVVGDFDTRQRSKVFALAVLPYEQMMARLREQG